MKPIKRHRVREDRQADTDERTQQTLGEQGPPLGHPEHTLNTEKGGVFLDRFLGYHFISCVAP